MAEINRTQWTHMDRCMHLEHSMKIKQQQLHDNSCTRHNVGKSGCSNEDLVATT